MLIDNNQTRGRILTDIKFCLSSFLNVSKGFIFYIRTKGRKISIVHNLKRFGYEYNDNGMYFILLISVSSIISVFCRTYTHTETSILCLLRQCNDDNTILLCENFSFQFLFFVMLCVWKLCDRIVYTNIK